VLATQISITYTEGTTGLEKTVTSPIGTDAPDNTELSNDGKDNDNDGLTDCQETGIGPCEYVVMADDLGASPKQITTAEMSIAFNRPIAGSWKATGSTLAFFVTDVGTATQAQANIQLAGWSTPTSIREGWNYITLPGNPPTPSSFTVKLKSLGGSFYVSNSANSISDPNGARPNVVVSLTPYID
jgi:hypothetical protein